MLIVCSFLQFLQLAPVINIVFTTQEALDLLVKYSHTIFTDGMLLSLLCALVLAFLLLLLIIYLGTFDITELNLTLTTILIRKETGVAIPLLWLLTNSKTTENYKWFFSFINKLTKDQMEVHIVLGDFEGPMRDAANTVFPRAQILGDSWHFYHDNCKWMNMNGGHANVGELNKQLHELLNAPSLLEFRQVQDQFVRYWSKAFPSYVNYYLKQWNRNVAIASWAAFGRPPTAPTGDQIMEGWHNRIKRIDFTRKTAIDFAAVALYNELTYWLSIHKNSNLEEARVIEITKNKSKNTRTVLRHYIPRSTEQLPSSASLYPAVLASSTTSSVPAASGAPTSAAPAPVAPIPAASVAPAPVAPVAPAPAAPVALAPATPTPVTPVAPAPAAPNELPSTLSTAQYSSHTGGKGKGSCEKCSKQRHQQCNLGLCMACCKTTLQYCGYTHHRRNKSEHVAATHPYVPPIDTAIANGAILWVKYDGPYSQHKGEWRALQPKRWDPRPWNFVAHCIRDNVEKRYNIQHVKGVNTTIPNNLQN